MNRIRRIYITGIVLMLFGQAFSQVREISLDEFIKGVDRMNEKLSSASTLEVDLDQEVKNQTTGEIEYSGEGYFLRKDSLYLKSRVMGVEIIQNKDRKVVIDTASQSVIVSKSEYLTPLSDLSRMKETLPLIKGLQLLGGKDSSGNQVYIAIYPPGTAVKSLKITVDKQGYLKEVSMLLTTKVESKSIEVLHRTTYKNYRLNKGVRNSSFSLNKVIDEDRDSIKLVSAFNGFKLINLIR